MPSNRNVQVIIKNKNKITKIAVLIADWLWSCGDPHSQQKARHADQRSGAQQRNLAPTLLVREPSDKNAEIIPQRKNLLNKKKITSEHLNIRVEEKEYLPSPSPQRSSSQWATGHSVNSKSIKLQEKCTGEKSLQSWATQRILIWRRRKMWQNAIYQNLNLSLKRYHWENKKAVHEKEQKPQMWTEWVHFLILGKRSTPKKGGCKKQLAGLQRCPLHQGHSGGQTKPWWHLDTGLITRANWLAVPGAG